MGHNFQEYRVNYKFEHIDSDGDKMHFEFEFDDAVTWDEVLQKFLKFLGAAYGYDISDEVSFTTTEDRIRAAQAKFGNTSWDDEEEEEEDDNTPSNS